MNKGKYVFSQLTEFLPRRIVNRTVAKHNGNKYVRHFTCLNQLLCMVFGQLTTRDSLRDLITVIEAHSPKSYHLGFRKSVTRSNLAKDKMLDSLKNRFYMSIFANFHYVKYLYLLKIKKMNISFTKKQEEYIARQVASGEYQNNSEVIRDALRLHEIYREKVIADLRAEIEKGWNGPDSTISVQDIIASRKQK